MKEIVFRGAMIPVNEANCLKEIEDSTLNQFTLIDNEIYHNMDGFGFNKQMRFNIKDGNISGIDLYHCGIEKLPESIECLELMD